MEGVSFKKALVKRMKLFFNNRLNIINLCLFIFLIYLLFNYLSMRKDKGKIEIKRKVNKMWESLAKKMKDKNVSKLKSNTGQTSSQGKKKPPHPSRKQSLSERKVPSRASDENNERELVASEKMKQEQKRKERERAQIREKEKEREKERRGKELGKRRKELKEEEQETEEKRFLLNKARREIFEDEENEEEAKEEKSEENEEETREEKKEVKMREEKQEKKQNMERKKKELKKKKVKVDTKFSVIQFSSSSLLNPVLKETSKANQVVAKHATVEFSTFLFSEEESLPSHLSQLSSKGAKWILLIPQSIVLGADLSPLLQLLSFHKHSSPLILLTQNSDGKIELNFVLLDLSNEKVKEMLSEWKNTIKETNEKEVFSSLQTTLSRRVDLVTKIGFEDSVEAKEGTQTLVSGPVLYLGKQQLSMLLEKAKRVAKETIDQLAQT